MSEAIFVEGLTKSYDGKTVINHLNLSVKSGTVFGLLGANEARNQALPVKLLYHIFITTIKSIGVFDIHAFIVHL